MTGKSEAPPGKTQPPSLKGNPSLLSLSEAAPLSHLQRQSLIYTYTHTHTLSLYPASRITSELELYTLALLLKSVIESLYKQSHYFDIISV